MASKLLQETQRTSWQCLLLLLLLVLPSGVQSLMCSQKSPCICHSPEFLIDLTPLGNSDGTARFSSIQSSDGEFRFSWNPCYPFTEKLCSDVASCQIKSDGSNAFSLGRQDTAQFVEVDGILALHYTDTTDIQRSSYIKLACARGEGVVTFDGEKPADSGKFFFTLRSKYMCPGGFTEDVPSTANLLIMIVVFLVVVYLALTGILSAVHRRILDLFRWCCRLFARRVSHV